MKETEHPQMKGQEKMREQEEEVNITQLTRSFSSELEPSN